MVKIWDEKEGKLVERGLYETTQCMTLRDIVHSNLDFSGFLKLKKPGSEKERFWRKYGCASKAELGRRIGGILFKLITEDLIENNNVYRFPVQRDACLRIVRQTPSDERFLMTRRSWGSGVYKDVDVFATGGALYMMVMDWFYGSKKKQNIVKLSYQHYKKIIAKANQGMVYFDDYGR